MKDNRQNALLPLAYLVLSVATGMVSLINLTRLRIAWLTVQAPGDMRISTVLGIVAGVLSAILLSLFVLVFRSTRLRQSGTVAVAALLASAFLTVYGILCTVWLTVTLELVPK